jgi:hypothetical protein
MSTIACLILPMSVVFINFALLETRRQNDLIQRRQSSRRMEASYWQTRSTDDTRTRAVNNMFGGFGLFVLYAVFGQPLFMLLSSMTMFGHTVYYLYLVWEENEKYIRMLPRNEEEKSVRGRTVERETENEDKNAIKTMLNEFLEKRNEMQKRFVEDECGVNTFARNNDKTE